MNKRINSKKKIKQSFGADTNNNMHDLFLYGYPGSSDKTTKYEKFVSR
jgi:hypothetical protein